MSENQIAVRAKNLSVQFDDFWAVKKISFEVRQGEIFGFLGANGAGKTTTIRVLCGLLAPTEGDIEVAGQKIFGRRSLVEIKKRVGYMSQKFTLYDDLTVHENLRFASELRKMMPKQFEKRRDELLSFINFQHNLKSMVRDLPGGIKQQVSLVAAVLHNPDLIFLDEPTAGVTPAARARFWKLITELTHQGKTVFVTTHYMDEAEQCDRIALMRNGELIALDALKTLKQNCFPQGLQQIEPKSSGDLPYLEKLSQNPAFSLYEPYGMRFHAEIADNSEWEKLQPELERHAQIRNVSASLEDVFIRLVEGGKNE